MSNNGHMYEVRVKVGQLLQSFHFERRTQKQAVAEASRHGKVVSARKVSPQLLVGNIENLKLEDNGQKPQLLNSKEPRQYLGGGIFEDQLDIDRMLGLKKSEVRKRRDTNMKHKKKLN